MLIIPCVLISCLFQLRAAVEDFVVRELVMEYLFVFGHKTWVM